MTNHSSHSWNDIRYWLHKLVDRVDYIENNCCGSSGSGVPSTIFNITTFISSPTAFEIGQNITLLSLTWAYNFGDPDTQSITPSPGNISPLAIRSTSVSNISTTTIFTLTATKGIVTQNKDVTVSAKYQRYWGASNVDFTLQATAGIPYIDLQNAGLSSELSLDKLQTRNIDCSTGKYFYFLWPVSFGLGTFTVNSLPFSGFSRNGTSIFITNLTNQFGQITPYYIYKSKNLLYGNNIPIIVV